VRARTWAVFAAVQGVAALGYWGHVYFTGSHLGLTLWVVGFVGLLPGDLVASELVGRLLWPTSLSLPALDALKFLFSVLLNVGCWALLLSILAHFRARKERTKHAPG
jgi:hypothetical protein